jgi:hypothetical protein
VPEISRFYGIIIRMWPKDDRHAPHFHARYGDDEIQIYISDGEVSGYLPPRKMTLVQRWLRLHRAELLENWRLMREGKLPRYIQPLD